jgi:short-subunit dehydrogenase
MNKPANGRRVIILGAQSAIAEAAARLFAQEGARLVLAGRDQGRLNEIADDLVVRGASQVHTAALDFQKEPDPQKRMHDFADRLGGVSHVLIAFGMAGNHARAATDLVEFRRIVDVNFTCAACWALAAADFLEQQRSGVLMAIGSVAADRGRASDYIHGAAKAGLGVLMQGVAHRLSRCGARAVLIKAGPVDSPMTAGVKRSGPPWSSPQEIAAVIYRAARRGGPIVYAPPAWRWRMLVARAAPAFVMHRVSSE